MQILQTDLHFLVILKEAEFYTALQIIYPTYTQQNNATNKLTHWHYMEPEGSLPPEHKHAKSPYPG